MRCPCRPDDLVACADRALYAAKTGGRNRAAAAAAAAARLDARV